MNSGGNVLGQGNRANLTIGRALQLVIRNVGGGRPGGVDRATHGNPGKLSFCFAEDEAGSPWTSLAESRGVPGGQDAVTVFAGEGPRCIVDQKARDPDAAGHHVRRVPAGRAPPEAGLRLRRHPGGRPGARSGVRRRRAGTASGSCRRSTSARQRPGAELVAGRRRHGRGHAGGVRGRHAAQVPRRRPAPRARGRAGRAVLCHHRRAGPTGPSAASRSPGRCPGEPRRGGRCDDPGDPRSRQRGAWPRSASSCPGRPRWTGRVVGLLDISKPGATSSSTASSSA